MIPMGKRALGLGNNTIFFFFFHFQNWIWSVLVLVNLYSRAINLIRFLHFIQFTPFIYLVYEVNEGRDFCRLHHDTPMPATVPGIGSCPKLID